MVSAVSNRRELDDGGFLPLSVEYRVKVSCCCFVAVVVERTDAGKNFSSAFDCYLYTCGIFVVFCRMNPLITASGVHDPSICCLFYFASMV